MESQTYEQENQINQISQFEEDIPGVITPAKMSSTSSDDQNWQEWVDVVVDFLAKVPEQLGSFFSDYKQPLTTLGLIITAAITVYITLSVLDAIDHIPLLSSILELVGLGYSAWFITRYLLKASTRQELFAEFDGLKQQVLGEKTHG
jgi:hypothetical protein